MAPIVELRPEDQPHHDAIRDGHVPRLPRSVHDKKTELRLVRPVAVFCEKALLEVLQESLACTLVEKLSVVEEPEAEVMLRGQVRDLPPSPRESRVDGVRDGGVEA
jgi:hypothetical protein